MGYIELTEFENKSYLKIDAEIKNTANKTVFSAKISGDISGIDFPEISRFTKRKNELWTIGCFEIFVNKKNNSYTEYNLGFDQNFEIFNFSDYRSNQSLSEIGAPPKIICETKNDSFAQFVEFPENIISENLFSITAVIKLSDGNFLYFANKHCGQEADFHLKNARILKL
ncbi:MAG: hypothetical protein LBH98_05525 [Chitinispirillales bacterium]|jgi:hypothetical protein|nr:hypothetical protein [Chitinispirillales bacterium]